MTEYLQLIPAAAAITTLGGAYLTIKKIARDSKKEHKERALEILQAAKDADSIVKGKLDSKIHDLESQLHNLKENVEKDLQHQKEYHSGEIKILGEKIETLRDELKTQNIGIVNLLAKLIDKK